MTEEIEVKLFGAFRQYGSEQSIAVSVPAAGTVADLRRAFAERLDDDNARELLKASAFATDRAVLEEDEALPGDGTVSILPPVCGG